MFSVGVVKKHRHQNWGIWCERHVFTKLIELDYDNKNNNKETEVFSKSSPTKSVATAGYFLLQIEFLLLRFLGFLDPVKEPETTQTSTTTGANRDFCETPSGKNAEMPSVAVGAG